MAILSQILILSKKDAADFRFYREAKGIAACSKLSSFSKLKITYLAQKGAVIAIDFDYAKADSTLNKKLKALAKKWGSLFPWIILVCEPPKALKNKKEFIKQMALICPQGIISPDASFKDLENLSLAFLKSDDIRGKVAMRKCLHTISQPLTILSGYISMIASSLEGKDILRAEILKKELNRLLDEYYTLRNQTKREK